MAPEPASAKQRHYLQGLPNARGVREGDCQALLSEARAQVGEGGQRSVIPGGGAVQNERIKARTFHCQDAVKDRLPFVRWIGDYRGIAEQELYTILDFDPFIQQEEA